MCMIETQIWEEVPEKKGYVRYVGQRKMAEVFSELEAYLKKENLYPDEYFLLSDERPEAEFPRGDIRCYAQWGSSEGIYLELEVLAAATKDKPARWINIASGKTLAQTAEAYDRMQYIAGKIYKAFCGDNFQSPRYIILDNKGDPEITYERLMSKLETELSDYMRRELLHKQLPVGDVSRKLGMMLTILSVIREPRVYADLPQDKVEQLYDIENVLEVLCDMCASVSEADLFEIGDIIASAPTFVQEQVEQTAEKTESTEEYYYGFTHFMRMEYKDIPHEEFVDQVTFGLYTRAGGCVSEASVLWTPFDGRIVPYIRVFEDGIKVAFSTKFLAVVDKLRTMGDFTPAQFSRSLIEQGFEDNSDVSLMNQENTEDRLGITASSIGLSHSEKIMNRIDYLKKKAASIGANFKHSFFDDRHLDCFWYDGKDYATIEYKGYTICFDVCGEVQATIVCDEEINEEGFVEICHRDGVEPLYFHSELKKILDDDTALNLYRQFRGTEIDAQNRVNVIITNQATGENACEPSASEYSNILEAVENAFDSYIKYIDDMVTEAGEK